MRKTIVWLVTSFALATSAVLAAGDSRRNDGEKGVTSAVVNQQAKRDGQAVESQQQISEEKKRLIENMRKFFNRSDEGLTVVKGPDGSESVDLKDHHELAHGLGFYSMVDAASGAKFKGSDDIYSKYIFDLTAGKHWDQMTDDERRASAVNTRRVVWDGPHVKAAASAVLSPGTPKLTVNSGSVKGDYVVDGAAFGPTSLLFLEF